MRDLSSTSGIPTSRCYTGQTSPQTSGFENQWGTVQKTTWPHGTEKPTLKGFACRLTGPENQWKHTRLQYTDHRWNPCTKLEVSSRDRGTSLNVPLGPRHWQKSLLWTQATMLMPVLGGTTFGLLPLTSKHQWALPDEASDRLHCWLSDNPAHQRPTAATAPAHQKGACSPPTRGPLSTRLCLRGGIVL